MSELTTSLTDARSEIKTLNTKLSAARNAEVNAKVHGSALKPNGGFRGAPVEVVQTAQAKEDLYGDLTGLIVRGMKHDGKEDVFDCIQAGRNGSKMTAHAPTYPAPILTQVFQHFTSNSPWTQQTLAATKMFSTRTARSWIPVVTVN